MTRILILLLSFSFLTSCDCYRIVIGKVIDKQTKLPISAAKITVIGSNNSTTTDSLGFFVLRIMNSGLQCACKPNNKIIITNSQYLTDTFKLNKSPFKMQTNIFNIKN